MNIVKYSSLDKKRWDDYIDKCKNKHFIFYREYMDYHSDRFKDFSLIIESSNGKIISVLPANLVDNVLYSHQGLTFGGFLIDDSMRTETMLKIFALVILFLKDHGIEKLVYKCVPYIYHAKPSEEDRYALFRCGAKLIRRDVTSTVDLSEKIRYSSSRKWSINKARREGLRIIESESYDQFWEVLTAVLENQHNATPVHTLDEIKRLSDKFPNNIKLFLVLKEDVVLSGAVIYENNSVVHTQYLANSILGRELRSLDLLIDYLIKEKYMTKKFFDFGISNEKSGKYLNSGLIAQKEDFGARPVVHDFYELNLH